MKTRSTVQKRAVSSRVLATAISLGVAALSITPAFAKIGTQMANFFYNDGAQVVSDNGEPDDAVLNRFYDTQHNGIEWQLMTQHLTPGASYDVWLEGTNDGTPSGSFRWWVGRATATPQGDLNVTGNVYVGAPPGGYAGWFTNSRAQLNLVIKTTDGATVQTAVFAAL
jgi:hypothetical protein